MPSGEVDEGKVEMNNIAPKNLRVQLGDLVHVEQLQNIEYDRRTGRSKRATLSSFVAACDP